MKRDTILLWPAAILTLALVGCAVDVPQLMKSDVALRSRVMEAISADSTMVDAMVERLLGADDTRSAMLDKVLADGGAAQETMMRMATDRTRLDGVISLAVQDSATKDHVMTLLKGMQMVETR
jgi:hypothetical protein